jgi:hypothetical protein
MADPKIEAPKKEELSIWTSVPFIMIIVILIIGAQISGETIFGEKVTREDDGSQPKKSFNLYTFIGSEEALRLGAPIINTKKVVVRTAPAGSIVGYQKKLETGRLMEGPVEAFNTKWWRVDYPVAPDGWIEHDSVSTNIKSVRFINIIPFVYGFYKPVGYGLLFILLFVVIYFKLMLKKEEDIAEKKKQLKDEQHQIPTKTIAQRIEEKPDVQELPGFQVEEIVPIAVAEKNGRWKHIQDLITSYNPSDWRQAIIEADIMLEEMLDQMGYDGVTIGDKLKNVEKSDFVTLDRAWSAHRVRNQIAHDGSAFKLNRDVAERTIKDFEEVFREFYYI